MKIYLPESLKSMYINPKYYTQPEHFHLLNMCNFQECLGIYDVIDNEVYSGITLYGAYKKIHQIHNPFKSFVGNHFV